MATRTAPLQPLHEQFFAHAARLSAKTAVIDATGCMTYEQMAAAVQMLAARFRERGLQGAVFAMLLPSGVAYTCAIMAVTACRGIFAPLDGNWTEQRLRSALAATAADIVLVFEDQLEQARRLLLDAGHSAQVMVLAFDAAAGTVILRAEIAGTMQPRLRSMAAGDWQDDSLYLICTSGSTGTPNVVEGRHVSLSHFIDWQTRAYGIDSTCRVAQLAPTTFDVSLRDFFLPLCNGGTLCIPTNKTKHHPVLLCHWIAEHRITVMHSVPSLFKFAAEVTEGEQFARSFHSVQKLFFSGERLYVADAQYCYQRLAPGAQIVNFYGPSEGTLVKAHFPVPRGFTSALATVPIGHAIDDCVLRISDGTRECVDGETGEIVIRTPYLSRGYYRNPELTRAKFTAASTPGVFLEYRTGDSGYFDVQGRLNFTGRLDHQVKIDGNRVELGEIESCLRGFDGIDAVVVVALGDPTSSPALACAYVSRSSASVDDVRAFATRQLSSHMRPSIIRKLTALPLLNNGKTDRKQVEQLLSSDPKR